MSRETSDDEAYRQREEIKTELRELRKAIEVLTGFLWRFNGGYSEDEGIRMARWKRERLDDLFDQTEEDDE